MNMNTDSGVSSLSESGVDPLEMSDFAKTMATPGNRLSSSRLNLDEGKKKNGLAQLVLTVVKLLHELLEKQAIRRIDGGGLRMKRLSVSDLR